MARLLSRVSRGNSSLLVLTFLFSLAVLITALVMTFRVSSEPAVETASLDISQSGVFVDEAVAVTPTVVPPARPFNIVDATGAGDPFSTFVASSSGDAPQPVTAGEPGAGNGARRLPDGYRDPDDDGFIRGPGLAITGRVTDPWGRGIAGVSVSPFSASPWAFTNPQPYITDSGGYFTVLVLSPGHFKLKFDASRYWAGEWYNNDASREQAVAVPSGASGVDAVLMPTGILHGRVNFPAGPLAIDVAAYKADRQEVVSWTVISPVSVRSATDFYFDETSSLPPGDYKLYFVPREGNVSPFWYGGATSWETAEPVTVRMGETTDIVVDIAPMPPAPESGAIFGQLYVGGNPDNPESYETALISVIDAHGENLVLAEQQTSRYFSFSGLPPGDYKLKVTLADGHVVWYRFFSDGTTFEIADATVITLSPQQLLRVDVYVTTVTASISGVVRTASGTVVAHNWIGFYRNGVEIPDGASITDAEGFYTGRVRPGTYRICVVNEITGAEHCIQSFTVGWREILTGIDITVPDDFLGCCATLDVFLEPASQMESEDGGLDADPQTDLPQDGQPGAPGGPAQPGGLTQPDAVEDSDSAEMEQTVRPARR